MSITAQLTSEYVPSSQPTAKNDFKMVLVIERRRRRAIYTC